MPYRRRYSRRYRRRRRRYSRRYRKKGSMAMARRALGLAKFVAKNVESKHIRGNAANLAIQAPSIGVSTTNLCSVPEGTDPNQRIGQKVTIHSCSVRMSIKLSPTFTGDSAQVRMIMLYSLYPANAFIAWADLFNSTATARAPNLFYSLVSNKKIKVLHDRTVTLYQDKPIQNIWWTVKRRMPQEYDAAGGGIANVVRGCLQLMAVSDQAAAGQEPTYDYEYTTRYYDA